MKLTRFFTIFIVLMVGMLLLSGCSSKPEDTDQNKSQEQNLDDDDKNDAKTKDSEDEEMKWITFKSEKFGFTLTIPSTWIIGDTESYGILLRADKDSTTYFFVDTDTSLFKDAADFTAEYHVNEMVQDIMRIRRDYTFEDPSQLEINGQLFTTINYHGVANDGLTYYYEAYYTSTKVLGYEMYYVTHEDDFDTHIDILRRIARSFELLT